MRPELKPDLELASRAFVSGGSAGDEGGMAGLSQMPAGGVRAGRGARPTFCSKTPPVRSSHRNAASSFPMVTHLGTGTGNSVRW